jgi:hypothetical protein
MRVEFQGGMVGGFFNSDGEFYVRHELDKDNESRMMQGEGSKRAAKAFCKWAAVHKEELEAMSFHEVYVKLREMGVRVHQWCAMD